MTIRNRITGHRRVRAGDLDPEMEVDVEVLDGNDDEARALLLSIDLLAALAQTQEQLHERRIELPTDAEALAEAWRLGGTPPAYEAKPWKMSAEEMLQEQYLILVTCRDEKHQVELLGRLAAQGLKCTAVMS